MASTKTSAISPKKPAKTVAAKPKASVKAKPTATPVTTKTANKPAPQSPTKSVALNAANAPLPAKKTKLVRDSFTLPETDHDLIKECKKIAVAQGRETKKSEVLRAAIRRFAALSTAEQLKAYAELAPVTVGRPKKR